MIRLLQRFHTDVHDITLDRAADIICQRIAVAFDENETSERNHVRIDRRMAFARDIAERRVALAAAVVGRIRRRVHRHFLFVFPLEFRLILQAFPDHIVRDARFLDAAIPLERTELCLRRRAENAVHRTQRKTVERQEILQARDFPAAVTHAKLAVPQRNGIQTLLRLRVDAARHRDVIVLLEILHGLFRRLAKDAVRILREIPRFGEPPLVALHAVTAVAALVLLSLLAVQRLLRLFVENSRLRKSLISLIFPQRRCRLEA